MKAVRAWCVKNLNTNSLELDSMCFSIQDMANFVIERYGMCDIVELAEEHWVQVVPVEIKEVEGE